jgi:DNA-directed RNA polymerase specialized sigma24 family protein
MLFGATWLVRILKNKIVDYYRKLGRSWMQASFLRARRRVGHLDDRVDSVPLANLVLAAIMVAMRPSRVVTPLLSKEQGDADGKITKTEAPQVARVIFRLLSRHEALPPCAEASFTCNEMGVCEYANATIREAGVFLTFGCNFGGE